MSLNQQELLQPSLSDDWKETKSYNIYYLLYVSFFGGVIPTIVLGTKNAKWLNINKKFIYLFFVLGIVILLAKVIGYSYLETMGLTDEYGRLLKTVYKAFALLLYLGYFSVMKSNYKRHIMFYDKTQPLLKDSLIWIVIAIIVEFILLVGGAFFFGLFI